jgi:hypothetical protein
LEVREDNKDYYAATIMSVDLSIRWLMRLALTGKWQL